MKVSELVEGQYAKVVPDGHKRDWTVVLALSKTCFTPDGATASVVNIANGIGSYSPDSECTVISASEAFRLAEKWLND